MLNLIHVTQSMILKKYYCLQNVRIFAKCVDFIQLDLI